jgi:hypothetical protein
MNDENINAPMDTPVPMPEQEATAAPVAEDTRPEDQTTLCLSKHP